MINIFYNEWKGFLRNKTFISSTSFFIVLLSLTTYFSIVQNNKQIKTKKFLCFMNYYSTMLRLLLF